ncbi:MAG: SDR family oxidoreductase [Acidobacteria bacterium]|nr:MAG: SDR family oxidoreductase [Acidobacteriota bacterium]
MGRLEGKVAVITGGGRGIGLAAVRLFLAEGAEVALWDLETDAIGQELADCDQDRLQLSALDIRKRGAVGDAAATVHARWGRIDILINNAGVTVGHVDTLRSSEKVWRDLVDTNLEGAVHCVQAIVPYMQRRGEGSIVNVTSVLARYGYPGQTAYVASKSALEGLTRVWAREFGPNGIRVNAVSPGYIRTKMNESNPPEVLTQVLTRTSLRRIGEPEDVAHLYLFLSSEEASFVTAAVIPVDGGFIP